MAPSLMAPTAVRARRVSALLLPVVLAAAVAGCGGHHKRTTLRPVYAAPAVGCPTGNCGGAVVPSAPASSTLTPLPPTTSTEPGLVEPGSAPGASVSGGPSSPGPSRPSDSPPPVTPPSLQGALPDEPGLEPAGAEERRPSATPEPKAPGVGGASARPLTPGTSMKSSGSRRTTSVRLRQAALVAGVRPFVDDPEGLVAPPKAGRPWKYIVLHHSASPKGGYDSIDREHRSRLGWQGCGYHFVIGNGSETPDGRIEVARRWTEQKHGVHCRDGKSPDVNEYGIGICLIGDLEKSPPTERQIVAARALVSYLSTRYQIAPDHTETHAHLAASPTSCPGRLFPSQAILGSSGVALR